MRDAVVARFLLAVNDRNEFWGEVGAGCVPFALDTGRVCLQRRSSHVNEPNTWGIWGGAVDQGESPVQAVKRELLEEAGYAGSARFTKLFVYRAGDFEYHNYLAEVASEFTPKHSWESSAHRWLDLQQDKLPSPLHFGFKALLPHLRKHLGRLRAR